MRNYSNDLRLRHRDDVYGGVRKSNRAATEMFFDDRRLRASLRRLFLDVLLGRRKDAGSLFVDLYTGLNYGSIRERVSAALLLGERTIFGFQAI